MRFRASDLLAILQLIAALRVILRLLRSASGPRIGAAPAPQASVAVIVPVLNEEGRLGPCLDGLVRQPSLVTAVLVVDGGSTDGTNALIGDFAGRDARIRAIDASPVPPGWNGKAWGLQVGWEQLDPGTEWVLTVDADVRARSHLVPSLIAHAARLGLDAFSVATPQRLSGALEAIVHPSLLATLVYRYGIPGSLATVPDAVQANGQCFLARTTALDRIGGFVAGRGAISEDVTIARSLVAAGVPVGFYEPKQDAGLIEVEMYAGWRDAWTNWTRSLPMRDHFSSTGWWLRMADLTLVMGLPILVLLAGVRHRSRLVRLNRSLLLFRYGVAFGMRRAYAHPPATFWVAPLVDPAAVGKLWIASLRRHHRWRGRPIVRAASASSPTGRD